MTVLDDSLWPPLRRSPMAAFEVFTGMFESEDYAALVPVRDRGFSEMNIVLTREM